MEQFKITKIQKQKTKLKLFFSDSSILTVMPIIKEQFNLYVSKEIDEKTLDKIKKANEIEELFDLSIKRLIVQSYSPNKLKEYLLKKNKNKSVVDQVIKKLQKYQLLNEDEIISNVIEYCNFKHYGFNRIIKVLKDREISLNKINQVTKDETREHKEALEQTKRLVKRYKRKNTVNLKQSVYSSLIRYGFDDSIASLEASKVFNSPLVELNMLKLEYSKLVLKYQKKLKGKELHNKITKALLSKGYRYNDIKIVTKEEDNYEIH